MGALDVKTILEYAYTHVRTHTRTNCCVNYICTCACQRQNRIFSNIFYTLIQKNLCSIFLQEYKNNSKKAFVKIVPAIFLT